MKQLFMLLMLSSLAIISCSKSTVPAKMLDRNITGKWQYAQSYYSIGGPLIYNSTENLGQWIEFKDNGRFASNMPKFQKVVQYEIIDSIKVKFITAMPRTESRFYVVVDSTGHSMSLSSADNMCIEGCGDIFKR